MAETKADIKNRMLKAASASWGFADTVNTASFDPLVGLLLEVYAAELEKISHEIDRSRERILQKMVQLMAPDVLTAPIPAHAIMQCQALGDAVRIQTTEQFYAARQYSNDGLKDTWFSPASNYHITDAFVKYQATGTKLFRYGNGNNREQVAASASALAPHTVWLGIAGEKNGWQNVQFYFEMPQENRQAAFYHHLPEVQWHIGNRQLVTHSGFNSEIKKESLADWMQGHTINRIVAKLVHDLYRDCFLTLQAVKEDIPSTASAFPLALQHAFGAQGDAIAQESNITWLRLDFPENIPATVLETIYCRVNCLPVINRQLHEITYRLHDWINIIPLASDEQFLDIQEVTDQQGRSLLASAGNNDNLPQLLLRKGGANRFDERDARAITEQLLQLLRDESAAFARYGRDFITDEVKKIQQTINRLNQQLIKNDTASDPAPYLEVNCRESNTPRHLLITYWSTQGAKANLLKSGTPLMAYRNGALRQDNLSLVTTTHGGRDYLKPHESIPAYKSAVLSKDRVMSTEDIRLFCLRETSPMGAAVEVKKGVMIAQGREKGYVKTIDVFINVHKNDYNSLVETKTMKQWTQRLELQLGERSLSFMPFRVFFKTAS
jgi:hypothetical protein